MGAPGVRLAAVLRKAAPVSAMPRPTAMKVIPRLLNQSRAVTSPVTRITTPARPMRDPARRALRPEDRRFPVTRLIVPLLAMWLPRCIDVGVTPNAFARLLSPLHGNLWPYAYAHPAGLPDLLRGRPGPLDRVR